MFDRKAINGREMSVDTHKGESDEFMKKESFNFELWP
jgi:hypothetical protein